MASRRKEYPFSNRHGHEKQLRDTIDPAKGASPRMEVTEYQPPKPKPAEVRPESNVPAAQPKLPHSLNSARLAADRIADFRRQRDLDEHPISGHRD